MGIEYRGVLIVGYDFEEFENIYNQFKAEGKTETEDLYHFSEELGLGQFSPYFDATSEDCFYGRSVEASPSYQAKEVSLESLTKKAPAVEEVLEDETGFTPRLYIMAQGW